MFDFGSRAAARKQRNRTGPLLCKPISNAQAQCASTAADQVRSILPNAFRRVRLLWPSTLEAQLSTRNRHHHLSNILPLRHVSKGVYRATGIELREFERPIVASFKVPHHFREQIPDVVGPLA